MKIKGKVIAKGEIKRPTPTLKKLKIEIETDTGLFEVWAFDTKVDFVNRIPVDSQVELECWSKDREWGGRTLTENYINSIAIIQTSVPHLEVPENFNFKKDPLRDYYYSLPKTVQEILERSLNQLQMKHLVNIDKFLFFKKVMDFVKLHGEQYATNRHKDVLEMEQTRITDANLDQVYFF